MYNHVFNQRQHPTCFCISAHSVKNEENNTPLSNLLLCSGDGDSGLSWHSTFRSPRQNWTSLQRSGIGPTCHLLQQSRYIWVCREARRGWLWFQRVSWFLEHTGWIGIGSDRTAHWNSPERLSLLLRAWDTFRLNVSGKFSMGCTCPQPFLPPVPTQHPVLISKLQPEDCAAGKFCKILQHCWQFVSVPYIFSAFVAKRFINSEGRCCGLAKKAWQLILSRANFPWPLLCLYPVSSKQHPWALGSSAK